MCLRYADKSVYWPNICASPLPFAPDMQLWSIYGQGIKTEISTDFVRNFDPNEPEYLPVSGTYKVGDGDGSVPIQVHYRSFYQTIANCIPAGRMRA